MIAHDAPVAENGGPATLLAMAHGEDLIRHAASEPSDVSLYCDGG